ncbi:MAG TPA: phosphatase PAP2 family protein [Candidatus Fermentibacter sp.]|nr:phosphatase PAP2 family protein [Candidatus Fermentibacter sp.]
MFDLKGKLLEAVADRYYRAILVICGAYSVAAALIPFMRLVPRWPAQLAIFALLYAGLRARAIPDWARRWFYYAMLTVSYQALRLLVSTCSDGFHGAGIIAMEQRFFGTLPTVWLQGALHPTHGFAWYDYIFAVLHASLFAFPFLLPGFLLWRRGVDSMKRASVAVVLISLAGYLTYVLFPLTPPWMAELEGDIHHAERVVYLALSSFTSDWLSGAFQPSPRGAMPSLHAGLPFMTLLVSLHEFGRRAWWVALPVAALCFEIVYGAEHYVVDVVAGLAYGLAAYLIVYRKLFPDAPGGGAPAGGKVG